MQHKMRKFKIIMVWILDAENEVKALELTKRTKHKRVVVQEIIKDLKGGIRQNGHTNK